MYKGGALAVLLYGHGSCRPMAKSISRLRNWHNKRTREIFRATLVQFYAYRTTPKHLQKRRGAFPLGHRPASRTLLWAGHAARMPKGHLPLRLMLPWVR